MGLPGKPPGSPILYDLVANRVGSRLKAGVTNGGVGNIAYKDSQQDFTKDSRKNITQDLEDCLKGERPKGKGVLGAWAFPLGQDARKVRGHPGPPLSPVAFAPKPLTKTGKYPPFGFPL